MTDPAYERPLVTFALFAYNQEKYIREAVEGAFSQTYEPLEIILSDDCSSDRTYEIIQEMAAAYEGPHEVRIRRNKLNVGFADHINIVVSDSNGKYIVWAAGDDVSLPERAKQLVKPFETDPDIVGTYSDIREIDVNGDQTGKVRRKNKQKQDPTLLDVIERNFSINTQSHCFNKNMMVQFPKLNSDLTYEAPCMTLRELLVGKVEYVSTITVNYRVGSGTSTYRGHNVHRRRQTEPAKVAEWRRSSAKQMLDDLEFFAVTGFAIEKQVLRRKIRGATRLREVNMKTLNIGGLLKNLVEGIYVRDTSRAFFRRNSPVWLWNFFSKKS